MSPLDPVAGPRDDDSERGSILSASAGEEVDSHAKGIGSTSRVLVVRKLVVTIAGAVATAVLARSMSLSSFGVFSAALATFYLMQAVCDLGFGAVLARELATRRDTRGAVLRAGTNAAVGWSLAVAAVMVGVAVASGDTTRAWSLAFLAPAVAVGGASITRQVYLVVYNARRIALVDTVCNLAQSALLIALGVAGFGAPALVCVVAAATIVNTAIVWSRAYREFPVERMDSVTPWRIFRMAAPFGVASIMSSAYFMIDTVIAGFLLPAREVAQYAAAVKLLSLVGVLPTLVMSVALAGLSAVTASGDRASLSQLAARVTSWFAALLLPVCVVVGLFAPTVVVLLFGADFGEAGTVTRILMGAGGVALLSNVLGALLVARDRGAAMLVQNLMALTANVVLNIVLQPRFGIEAAAWLTLATEVFVCGCSVVWIGRSVAWTTIASAAVKPAVAVAAVGASWLALPTGLAGVVVGVLVYVIVLSLLRGWPDGMDPVVGVKRLLRTDRRSERTTSA